MHYRMAFDEEGIPMMYIFSTCQAFIRTIPLLLYDAHRPEDIDTDLEDHVADEVRYFCMMRPMKPIQKQQQPQKMYNPLDDDTRYDDYAYYRRLG